LVILLLSIGKLKLSGVVELSNEYKKRLTRFVSFRHEIITDVKHSSSLPTEVLKSRESEVFIKYLKPSDVVIVLDEKGVQPNSNEMASWIEDWQIKGVQRLVFIIGGSYGHGQELLDKAQMKVSFSNLTFNHQMMVPLFVEQLYRAYTLIHHHPYHHQD
jgi:23S rRNA (pseudouridine1915-N3)-methyltransferase